MSKHVFAVLMEALEEEYGAVTQQQLSKAIGVTQPTISNWKNGGTPSKSNIKKILDFYRQHHATTLVKTLVEFCPIEPFQTGASWGFSSRVEDAKNLKQQIEKRAGIYIFYDSVGRAIYLGKSDKCLYTEAKQRLLAVSNRQFYEPSKNGHWCMGWFARYISAYEVSLVAAVKNIESFMLRSFPNDLMNKNSGNFKSLLKS